VAAPGVLGAILTNRCSTLDFSITVTSAAPSGPRISQLRRAVIHRQQANRIITLLGYLMNFARE